MSLNPFFGWSASRSKRVSAQVARRSRFRPVLEALETRQVPSAIFTVTNTADSGPGSLRQAILDANANPGTDAIRFQIPGSGVQTISPASALPTITDPVVLDGTAQPGYAGTPLIELAGSMAGAGVSGLVITAGASSVKGLAVNRFSADGIDLMTNGGNVIQASCIGTDASGSVALGNGGHGILITGGAHDNTVGGLTTTPGTGAGNVISGNQQNGIFLDPSAGANTVIQGNLIGLDASGGSRLANAGAGVFLNAGFHTLIGGTDARARNVISGNTNGIILSTGGSTFGIAIQGNYVGTDITGSLERGNSNDGVSIGSPGTVLGGPSAGAGNLISGNSSAAVEISGISVPVINGQYNSLVQGNTIGLNASGTAALPNFEGIVIENSNNLIGGTSAGARNVISGNFSHGVVIASSIYGGGPNLVQGNYVGTDASGSVALGNGGHGILVTGGAHDNTIGGLTTTPGTGAGNVISGNQQNGIFLDPSAGANTVIQGNLIGLDASGGSRLANAGAGVFLNAGFGTHIGGTDARARNVISGNTNGIILSLSGSTFNVIIQGNYVGTDITGGLARGNTNDGVGIGSAPGTLLGGTVAGAGNLISGNASAGVEISGISYPVINGLYNSLVQGNLIGLNASGTAALGNFTGVTIENSNNLIGGAFAGARNVISGNASAGVVIGGNNTSGNVVQSNNIGTDATGTYAVGNGVYGVLVDASASNNLIGGNTSAARNVISGNGSDGVDLRDGASGNFVMGNYIGTNAAGSAGLANVFVGIRILFSNNNTIGGTTAGARNVISGNETGIATNGAGNLVMGNYIGTDATGSFAIGNPSVGVFIDGVATSGVSGNVIGGTAAGAGNVISGNGDAGVDIAGANATGNFVQGNRIGTDASGTMPLGNSVYGVLLDASASNNLIGGAPSAGNIIAYNGSSGVAVDSGTGNSILSNSIFSNGGLGIDLFPVGVTLNDHCDGDTGANNLQNFPVLTSAVATATTITISGTLDSTANSNFLVQFFANASCDPSGYGEGAVLLGSLLVTTNGSCIASFSVTLVASVPAGEFVTATATLALSGTPSDTSEFSQCVVVTSGT